MIEILCDLKMINRVAPELCGRCVGLLVETGEGSVRVWLRACVPEKQRVTQFDPNTL
jgi:hypothetical protein